MLPGNSHHVQGDFVVALLDCIGPELNKPAKDVTEVTLNHLLRTALMASAGGGQEEGGVQERLKACSRTPAGQHLLPRRHCALLQHYTQPVWKRALHMCEGFLVLSEEVYCLQQYRGHVSENFLCKHADVLTGMCSNNAMQVKERLAGMFSP